MMKEDKQFLSLFHLSQLSGFLLPSFGSFVVPLVIWILRKDEIYMLDYHAKAVLNFQLSIFIFSLACIPLIFIGVGIFLLIILWLISLIYPIINTLRVNNDQDIKYPLNIKLIK